MHAMAKAAMSGKSQVGCSGGQRNRCESRLKIVMPNKGRPARKTSPVATIRFMFNPCIDLPPDRDRRLKLLDSRPSPASAAGRPLSSNNLIGRSINCVPPVAPKAVFLHRIWTERAEVPQMRFTIDAVQVCETTMNSVICLLETNVSH